MKEDNSSEVKEITKIITNDFSRYGFNSVLSGDQFGDILELKIFLAGKILEMLDRNYDKLINVLYLLDINERKVAEVFQKDKNDIPFALAELIIDRQLQKLKWREMYRKGEI